MKQQNKSTYDAPLCRIIVLPPRSSILRVSENSGSTKDIDYEDI